jgi:hypothetical protein
MKTIHLNDIKSPLTSVSRLFEPNAYGGSHYEQALAPWYPASRSDLLHRIRPNDNAGRPSRPNGKGRLVHFKRLLRREDMRLHEPSAMPSYKGRTRRLLLSRFIRGRHVGCARLRPEGCAASEQLKVVRHDGRAPTLARPSAVTGNHCARFAAMQEAERRHGPVEGLAQSQKSNTSRDESRVLISLILRRASCIGGIAFCARFRNDRWSNG